MNQQYQKRVRIFHQCAPHTGAGTVPAAETLFLSVGNRLTGGDAPYNSNFPFLKPTRAQRECTSHHKGGLLELCHLELNALSPHVYLSTSDGSKIVATDANLLPLFKRTFDVCNGESGVLTMKDGAQGDNGRLIVKVRSSRPCGVDNPARQVALKKAPRTMPEGCRKKTQAIAVWFVADSSTCRH
ncbi:hypothetical protein PSTG_16470 [Puccinia striiformis f. sp. tritici PST-78]|uniref:Uncharacterized protein n=1 Tax=Puccinia striiformis f. sp. tritici PST-78 TaxID=1165861 RepID=A0A0L0USU2_9BASI|nr:hypothetical protein PSTG_16470 [Puccinia striiformis f. sp. tritici PST-78]